MAKLSEVPAATPTWEPSASESDNDDNDNEPLFTLSDQDKLDLLRLHPDLKPSQVPDGNKAGKSPLVVLSPDELHRLAAGGQVTDDQAEVEVEEAELWEEIVDCVLWSIPFGFLFYCM